MSSPLPRSSVHNHLCMTIFANWNKGQYLYSGACRLHFRSLSSVLQSLGRRRAKKIRYHILQWLKNSDVQGSGAASFWSETQFCRWQAIVSSAWAAGCKHPTRTAHGHWSHLCHSRGRRYREQEGSQCQEVWLLPSLHVLKWLHDSLLWLDLKTAYDQPGC